MYTSNWYWIKYETFINPIQCGRFFFDLFKTFKVKFSLYWMYHYQIVTQFFANLVIIRMMNNDEIVLIKCPFHFIFSCLFCLNFLFKFEYSTRMAYIYFLASNKRTIEFFLYENQQTLDTYGIPSRVWSSMNTSSLKYII